MPRAICYPELVAIGAPPLRNDVIFLDHGQPIGSAALGDNGTLASLTIQHLAGGSHVFTARYGGDEFYHDHDFGFATAQGKPHGSKGPLPPHRSVRVGRDVVSASALARHESVPVGAIRALSGIDRH